MILKTVNGGTNKPAYAGNLRPAETDSLVASLQSRKIKRSSYSNIPVGADLRKRKAAFGNGGRFQLRAFLSGDGERFSFLHGVKTP
jgi:hypothetical protein